MSWIDSECKFFEYAQELLSKKILNYEQHDKLCKLYKQARNDFEKYLVSDSRWF